MRLLDIAAPPAERPGGADDFGGAVIRRLVRDWLDGLRAGFDVPRWGQAYPRTLPLRARGGQIPAYRPRQGERLVILSPGRAITDPDEAEALGLTADARRMRRQEERRWT